MTLPGTLETTVRPTRIPQLLAVVTVAVVLVADQATKTLAVQKLIDGPVDILGPWRLRLVANRGAILGIPAPAWLLFAGFGIVAAMALVAVRRAPPMRIAAGYGLVVGGAAGNIVDRILHRPRFPGHAVVDWIGSSFLPTFNLADVDILLGLILLARASNRDATMPSQGHSRSRRSAQT